MRWVGPAAIVAGLIVVQAGVKLDHDKLVFAGVALVVGGLLLIIGMGITEALT